MRRPDHIDHSHDAMMKELRDIEHDRRRRDGPTTWPMNSNRLGALDV
jgi:hypothetical protein